MVPYLKKKLESPSPKCALCQVWLKLAHWFWRKRFLNFVNVILLFRYYVPLGKCRAFHLNKLESPSVKNVLCWVWSKLAVVLEKKVKMWKVLQTNRQTKDARRARWAKNVFLRMISVENTKHHQCQLCRFTALSKKCQITRRPKENFFFIKHPLKFLLLVTLW